MPDCIGRDIATGEEGFNLAAVMLLGKDDVILNVAPAYVTDALVRKVNVDRYDDREVIKTNLIESYDRLMEFGKKHLPDKFFLEDTVNKSLRNTILREMVSNVLMHREFSNSYTAKFVIEKERMYVENANRATSDGYITMDNLEPNPKNPIIASFFRNIGYADQLGSGVRNLFKYGKYYSGKETEFIEGDVFRIIVPLDDEYSYDFGQTASETNETNETKSETNQLRLISKWSLTDEEKKIMLLIKEEPAITQKVLHEKSEIPLGTIKRILPRLQKNGVISRVGNNRSGEWKLNENN
ncbi:winged helix-turn-helix transcriptional regulator [Hominifimenecus sp. rT4P-3]|uniref:winged helix-turn-helix transcriptional regulator n=1 Tax=Hominifimenecus sp. rT4P-3 TaxID=3242979 RepID=UPI003DA51F2B